MHPVGWAPTEGRSAPRKHHWSNRPEPTVIYQHRSQRCTRNSATAPLTSAGRQYYTVSDELLFRLTIYHRCHRPRLVPQRNERLRSLRSPILIAHLSARPSLLGFFYLKGHIPTHIKATGIATKKNISSFDGSGWIATPNKNLGHRGQQSQSLNSRGSPAEPSQFN